MHVAWTRYVYGRLKSDFRYSNTIVYNNSSWPNIVNSPAKTVSNVPLTQLIRAQIAPEHIADNKPVATNSDTTDVKSTTQTRLTKKTAAQPVTPMMANAWLFSSSAIRH